MNLWIVCIVCWVFVFERSPTHLECPEDENYVIFILVSFVPTTRSGTWIGTPKMLFELLNVIRNGCV